jgi:uncharacterized protein
VGETATGVYRHRHPVSTMANGTEIALTVHEIHGTLGDGPTLGLCASIHGNEPTGTEIILDTARRLAERRFRGRLLLLPVANPLAFEANRRHTPLDDQNMNRVFPGNPDGWHTERLADVMTREFLAKVDVLIDLHSGGDRPTVDYVYIRNAEALSRAFGSAVLYRPVEGKSGTMFQGTSIGVTEERGVPSVTVELGGGLVDQRPYVERGVQGVLNVMTALKQLDGDGVELPSQTVLDSILTVRPHHGGLLETSAPALGESIADGDVLGSVVSPYTFEVLEEIRNPVANGVMVLSHLSRNLVHPGDYGYMVGSKATNGEPREED